MARRCLLVGCGEAAPQVKKYVWCIAGDFGTCGYSGRRRCRLIGPRTPHRGQLRGKAEGPLRPQWDWERRIQIPFVYGEIWDYGRNLKWRWKVGLWESDDGRSRRWMNSSKMWRGGRRSVYESEMLALSDKLVWLVRAHPVQGSQRNQSSKTVRRNF